MAISWFHFVAMLILTGLLFRLIETTWPDSAVGRALMVVY